MIGREEEEEEEEEEERMLQRAARNAYSWWWASHVRTKQSKWLDQNLQDMEEKVEYILKIVDDDGDTFRQRAEMYYRKRPEIVNFVEDSFRGYRALAERYDHISKELQSANRAIAAVYPERVPFEMDENDDFDMEKFYAVGLPSDESSMSLKNPPAAPKLNIPKLPNASRKNSKAPTRIMSRKGLLKINAGHDAVPVPNPVPIPSSGLHKSEALQKIDKLQKEILSLQTEKEFLRSSYESGLERYWEIEKQITEMQGEVNDLQDEFGIGMVIGDDEARRLMTASAIRSCQETLARLQQKQDKTANVACLQFQKVQEARENFVRLKEKLKNNQSDQDKHLVEKELLSSDLKQNILAQEEGCAEKTIHDPESLQKKIKEELQASSGNSLTIYELAEKVDELVDTVISLENAVSSQDAYVKRIRSETTELYMHIQSLEGEKVMLIADSSSKSNKIRELEEELERVQSLNQSIKQQNNHLQAQFLEAHCSLDDLSEKLLNVKPDEEDESVNSSQTTDVLGVNPGKQIQLQEVVTTNSVPEGLKDLNAKEVAQKADKLKQNTCDVREQKNLAISSYPENHKMVVSSGTNRQLGVRAMDAMITPGCSLVKKDNDKILPHSRQRITINNFHRSSARATSEWETDIILSDHGNDLVYQLGKHPSEAGGSDASARGLTEWHNVTSASDIFIERDMIEEATKENFSLTNEVNHNDIYSSKDQEGNFLHVNPENSDRKRDSIFPSKSIEERKGETCGLYNPRSVEESYCGSQRRHSGNDIGNSPINCSGETVRDCSEGKSDERRDSNTPAEDVEMKDELKQSRLPGPSTNKLEDENCSWYRENLSGQRVIDKNTGMEETKNDVSNNMSPVKPKINSGHSNLFPRPNDQMRSTSETNQHQKGFNQSENMADPGSILNVSRDVEMVGNVKQNSLSDQGNHRKPNKPNLLQIEPREVNIDEFELGEDDQPNWRELFLNGLDDKEKILLQEYTSVLRNYKETRRKLNEVEKKKRASLFQYCIQIKVLKSSNATKDAEIQSLLKQLNLFQENQEEAVKSKEGVTMVTSLHVSDDQSLRRDHKGLQDFSGEETYEATDTTEESTLLEHPKISRVEEDEGVKVIKVDEPPKLSIIEEKIRTDIDELLEENIEFWMRFSATFHQVGKFQTSVRDLKEEIAKLREKRKKGVITEDQQSLISDIRPIYRHLTEIQTELSLWLDQNVVIKDDLENRLSSLSSIEEEIKRLSSAGSKEEVTELDDYQAAKFQGEVLNMKQENNKFAHELQSGLQRVKKLQIEIEKTLRELDDEFHVSVKRQQSRYNKEVNSRIPLRSFLFGVKLKKQKRPSFLSCISPSVQKHRRDLPLFPI